MSVSEAGTRKSGERDLFCGSCFMWFSSVSCSSYKQNVRTNARAMLKLMNGADMAKHSLSSLGSANCFVDSLYNGVDFDCNVSRYSSLEKHNMCCWVLTPVKNTAGPSRETTKKTTFLQIPIDAVPILQNFKSQPWLRFTMYFTLTTFAVLEKMILKSVLRSWQKCAKHCTCDPKVTTWGQSLFSKIQIFHIDP